MMGLSDGLKSFKIGLVVLIQYRPWQTATQPPSHVDVAIRLYAIASSSKTDTYCWWMPSSRLLLTVQPHHWWREDEHLCVLHDSSDQLSSSLGGESLLCNSRRWPWKDKWSLQDNLYIGNIYLFTIVQKRLQGLGTEQFSVCTYFLTSPCVRSTL